MEYVSFRLDTSILKQIERGMKEFHYSTKSDFLRDAVREKLRCLEEEKARKKGWEALFAARGAFKDQAMSDEEFYKKREAFSKKLEKELKAKYNLK